MNGTSGVSRCTARCTATYTKPMGHVVSAVTQNGITKYVCRKRAIGKSNYWDSLVCKKCHELGKAVLVAPISALQRKIRSLGLINDPVKRKAADLYMESFKEALIVRHTQARTNMRAALAQLRRQLKKIVGEDVVSKAISVESLKEEARKRARATKKRASSTDTGTASKRPKNMPGMTRQMSQMYATEFNIPREVARNILAENPQLRKPGQLESLRDLGSLGKTMFTKSFVAKPSVVPPVGEPSAERHHSSEEETDSSESSAEESSEEEPVKRPVPA